MKSLSQASEALPALVNLTYALLVLAASVVVLWFIKDLCFHLIGRRRFARALLTSMRLQQDSIRSYCSVLTEFRDQYLSEAKTVPFPVGYNPTQYELSNPYQSRLHLFLRRRHITCTIHFYYLLKEFQVAGSGFCELVKVYHDSGRTLKEADLQYLDKILHKLAQLSEDINRNKISRLMDLDSYYPDAVDQP